MLNIVGWKAGDVESKRLNYAISMFGTVGARLKYLRDKAVKKDPTLKGTLRELFGIDIDLDAKIMEFDREIPRLEDSLDDM